MHVPKQVEYLMYMYGKVLSVRYNSFVHNLPIHVRGYSSVFVEVVAYRFAHVQMSVGKGLLKTFY